MEILVFGGTVFVSRAMAETAVARGHTVTTFNRGLSGPPVEGARQLTGDRGDPEALDQLAGRRFDLAFDTAYDPALVAASTQLLADTTDHYAYVSSINAFPGWPEQQDYHAGGVWDADPDSDEPEDLDPGQAYGWRKVKAERTVLREYGKERASILRAGCIVGPNDGVGRLPWWLDRAARGGEILSPGAPGAQVRLIDCRDIAEFALLRASGTFELAGPAGQLSRAGLIDLARAVTGTTATGTTATGTAGGGAGAGAATAPDAATTVTWVPDEFLAGKVEGWTELPLWLPDNEVPSLFAHHTEQAEAAGLRCRPIGQTMADTWAWMRQVEGGWQASERTPGLDPAKEAELLSEWHRGI